MKGEEDVTLKTLTFKMKNTKFISLFHLFKDGSSEGGTISLGNKIELPLLFKRIGWRLVFACFPKKSKISNRLIQLNKFGVYLLSMTDRHGPVYTVQYLKTCQLALQKFIAEEKVGCMRELNPDYSFPALIKGLPRVIPSRDSRLIKAGSPSVIRWWLTLFSVYRVVSIPGKLKLSTITDPLSVPQENLEKVARGLRVVTRKFRSMLFSIPKEPKAPILNLETASPSHVVSWIGKYYDAISIGKNECLSNAARVLMKTFDLVNLSFAFESIVSKREVLTSWGVGRNTKESMVNGLGQLSTKLEPAGKIRVFAMVDIWTQSILRPLHDAIFSCLKNLPNDGTMDQSASVKRCFSKALETGQSFGYDLSAATDRLPVFLQVEVLSVLIGREAASAWRDLLVNRPYSLLMSADPKVKPSPEDALELHYAVGQPMGALSSWGMLALTHHLIVQLACIRARGPLRSEWYTGYEVLGDDINIFDADVASAYLSLCDEIGLPINKTKSVCSTNGSCEFAKVTGYKGQDVSAISWKMFMSQNTLMGRANIIFSLFQKGIAPKELFPWMRRVTAKSRWDLGSFNYTLLAFATMLSNKGTILVEDVLKCIPSLEYPTRRLAKALLLNLDIECLKSLVSSGIRGVPPIFPRSRVKMWGTLGFWVKLKVFAPLDEFYTYLSAYKYREPLASAIFELYFPEVNIPAWIRDCIPRVTKYPDDYTPEQLLMGEQYISLLRDVESHLEQYTVQSKRKWLSNPEGHSFQELLEFQANKERIEQYGFLAARAIAKLAKVDNLPPKKTIASPLNALRFIAGVTWKLTPQVADLWRGSRWLLVNNDYSVDLGSTKWWDTYQMVIRAIQKSKKKVRKASRANSSRRK